VKKDMFSRLNKLSKQCFLTMGIGCIIAVIMLIVNMITSNVLIWLISMLASMFGLGYAVCGATLMFRFKRLGIEG